MAEVQRAADRRRRGVDREHLDPGTGAVEAVDAAARHRSAHLRSSPSRVGLVGGFGCMRRLAYPRGRSSGRPMMIASHSSPVRRR